MYKVYIGASTQRFNIGVGQYGTEQDRMMQLSDIVKYYLDAQHDQFQVYRNMPGWSLKHTVDDANVLKCDLFVDNHTNAGKLLAEGTETFYFGQMSEDGERLATLLYEAIAPVSPGKDRGVYDSHILYPNGLYILRETHMPAALIEHFFHTNITEVNYFITNANKFAKAEAQAICNYFGITFVDPDNNPVKIDPTAQLIKELMHDGLITDENEWYDILTEKKPINIEWLKIVLIRATDKI